MSKEVEFKWNMGEENGIFFVMSDEGGLRFCIMSDDGEIKRRADEIEDGAHWIEEYGICKSIYLTNNMYTDDGALKMWEACIASAISNRLEIA